MKFQYAISASIAALSLASVSVPVNAQQTESSSIEDGEADDNVILVTAQRREQKLQDVPSSIAAYGSEEIGNLQATQLSELTNFTPNTQVTYPYGEGGPPNFIVRGISSTDYSPNQSRPVAIYNDESIRNLQALEVTPLYDVARVEILRGPQGTLYGKNATGGAINIVTEKPGFDTEGYLTASYGNFNRVRIQGAVQTPIISDVLSMRVAGIYVRDDGVFENISPGAGDLNQTDMFSVRGSLNFEPSSQFDAVLRFTYTDVGGRNYGIFARNINLDGGFVGPNDLDQVPGANRENVGFFQNDTSFTPERDIEIFGLNLVMNWTPVDEITFTSVTSYDWGDWVDRSDSDGLPVMVDEPIVSRGENVKQFVQELRIATDFDGPFNFQAGVLYTDDQVDAGFDYGFFLDPRCGAPCNFGTSATGTGTTQANLFRQERESFATYMRGELEITPEVTVFGGVRFSWDDVAVSNYNAFLGDSSDFFLFPSIVGYSAKRKFENTSFEAGVNYKPNSDILLYASFREGYRTGAVNAQGFFDISEITFAPPETARTFEAGFKSSFLGGDVVVNGAVFQTDYKNQQVVVTEQGGLIFPLRSISGASILGFEADVMLRASNRAKFNLSVGVLDPKYDDNATISGASGLNVGGNQLINAPKFSFNANADVVLAEMSSGTVDLNVNAAYVSRIFFDVFESKSENGYWLANARLAYNADQWSIGAGIKNIFNTKYFTYGLDLQSLGFDYFQRGMPRQYGVDATFRF